MTSRLSLARYLDRIGYTGPLGLDLATLKAIHRAHLRAIPYENLDIHLGRPLSLDLEAQFAKLVLDRRGGWCYEMNGVLAWALGELGFRIRMVSGAVGRSSRGDQVDGNHLVLIGELDQLYLVDVGFGDGPLEPLPLVAGLHRLDWLEFRLVESAGRWVLHNHPFGGAPEFDFNLAPRSIPDFAAKCHELQTSPDSGFVKTTVCQRYEEDGLVSLRGAVLRTVTRAGQHERDVTSQDEYQGVLENRFGIHLAAARLERLWERVWARHLAWRATA